MELFSRIFVLFVLLVGREAFSEGLIDESKKNWDLKSLDSYLDVLERSYTQLNYQDNEGKTALHWLAKFDSVYPATFLLLDGADPNMTDKRGYTPLMVAVQSNSRDILRSLILKKANVNTVARDGETALSLAIRNKNEDVVEFLLWIGANPNPLRSSFRDPMSLAKEIGNPRISQLLRLYNENSEDSKSQSFLNLMNKREGTFQAAAKKGDFLTMQEMSRDGYNIDWKDPQGYTALHRAVGEVRMDAVFYLLLMGANANVRDDKNDQSPLMYSEGWHGPRSAVMRSYLILGGADPFAVNAEGWSEIGWTAKKGNLNGFRLLRMLGADPAAKTQKGTLYQIAVQEGHQPLIDELQKLGVKEKEVLNDDPEWLLLNAVRRGNVDQMEKLLDGGISPNLVQKKGNSLLMEAISHQQFSVSRRLMERGADLNYQNPNTGMTPLFCTIGYSDPLNADFRKEIIQKGAKVNVADKSGCTPLMKAVWFSKWHTRLSPLFIQLVDAGANLSAQDNQGVSVLNLAISEGSPAVVNYLKSKGAH